MTDNLVARRRDEYAALRNVVKIIERDADLLGPAGLRHLREKIDGLLSPITPSRAAKTSADYELEEEANRRATIAALPCKD